MTEVRIHGRGGQGSVVLAELIAVAAWNDGKYCQAFPYLGGGGERRGAPVQAFARMSGQPIRLRCRIQAPDYVLVQDPSLVGLVDVAKGVKPGGLILVNDEAVPESLGANGEYRVIAVPASRVALERTGRVITNMAMLGAFARATGELTLESVLAAVGQRFAADVRELNECSVKAGYEAADAPGRGEDR